MTSQIVAVHLSNISWKFNSNLTNLSWFISGDTWAKTRPSSFAFHVSGNSNVRIKYPPAQDDANEGFWMEVTRSLSDFKRTLVNETSPWTASVHQITFKSSCTINWLQHIPQCFKWHLYSDKHSQKVKWQAKRKGHGRIRPTQTDILLNLREQDAFCLSHGKYQM